MVVASCHGALPAPRPSSNILSLQVVHIFSFPFFFYTHSHWHQHLLTSPSPSYFRFLAFFFAFFHLQHSLFQTLADPPFLPFRLPRTMSRPTLPAISTDCATAAPVNTQDTTEMGNASPSEFDFVAFLRSIDSAQSYTISEIARRDSSIIVRARKELQQASDLGQNIAQNFGAFPRHESLMLTYAPVRLQPPSEGPSDSNNGQSSPSLPSPLVSGAD